MPAPAQRPTARRPVARLLARLTAAATAAALVAGTVGPGTLASAQAPPPLDPADQPPPGAVDGWPVGSDEPPPESEDVPDAGTEGDLGAAAATVRYFGEGAYWAVRQSVDATSRSCSISALGLTALVLAPVFKESSGATTPATAPSPMTLSRYDEWTGTYPTSTATDTNKNANYGLYAFRNPDTEYPRAFWHPGIGIWQYDSAGIGAPFTAIERMDTGSVSADVARVVATRYCAASGTDLQRRYAAWTDWGYPCTLCEAAFQELMQNRSGAAPSGFTTLQLVAGIDRLGGVQARTCRFGDGSQRPCWYVDPARAQGARWWATGLPVDDRNPRGGTTPLSAPFYVYTAAGREHRVWLAEDTTYRIDIAGSRLLGRNARPRLNQSGSGITWAQGTTLCDITASRGRCSQAPSTIDQPPAGLTSATVSVGGSSYEPLVGDFDGNGFDDVFWYAPGTAADYVWWSEGPATFSSQPISVSGFFAPVVGDVDGDGRDDVLWYSPNGNDYLWRAPTGRTFTSSGFTLGPGRRPLLLELLPVGGREVLAHAPGQSSHSLLVWNGSALVPFVSVAVPPTAVPVLGDFGGTADGPDVFWYGPGSAPDQVWRLKAGGGFQAVALSVSGAHYQPFAGDFDGNGADDIFWYGPGSGGDSIWWGSPGGGFTGGGASVSGTYQPVVLDIDADGADDILWYGVGVVADSWWRFGAGRTPATQGILLDQILVLRRGTFGSGDGLLLYGPGGAPDAVWYR